MISLEFYHFAAITKLFLLFFFTNFFFLSLFPFDSFNYAKSLLSDTHEYYSLLLCACLSFLHLIFFFFTSYMSAFEIKKKTRPSWFSIHRELKILNRALRMRETRMKTLLTSTCYVLCERFMLTWNFYIERNVEFFIHVGIIFWKGWTYT